MHVIFNRNYDPARKVLAKHIERNNMYLQGLPSFFLFDSAEGLKEVTLFKYGDEISLFLVCGCLINEK